MSQKGSHLRKDSGRKKKTAKKAVIIVVVVLLVVLAAGYAVFHHMYNQMTIVPRRSSEPDTATAADTAAPEVTPDSSTPEPTDTPEPTPKPLTEEEKRAQEEAELLLSLEKDAEEILYNENVYNILLIGADGVKDTLERSDAMLLLSINKETKKIWITSFMRDTQVTIPGWGGGQHLNWATQYGGEEHGVELLISTLESEKNFAIHIDNWAMVNFLDFGEVADLLGPITVTVTPEEAKGMNALIRQVCQLRDRKYGLSGDTATTRSLFKKKGGTFKITNGIQILAYCRERYTYVDGHYGDTGRSNKQREVLMAMWENVRKMNLLQQYALAEKVMSIVTTDLSEGKCFSLLLMAPSLMDYEVCQQQIPHPDAMTKGLNANGLSTYFPDLKVNRNILRGTIYGQELSDRDLYSSFTGKYVTLPGN